MIYIKRGKWDATEEITKAIESMLDGDDYGRGAVEAAAATAANNSAMLARLVSFLCETQVIRETKDLATILCGYVPNGFEVIVEEEDE